MVEWFYKADGEEVCLFVSLLLLREVRCLSLIYMWNGKM